MKKRIIATVMLIALAGQPVYASTQPVTLSTFESTLKNIEQNYYKPVSRDLLLQSALKGMLESLDPYSEYYSAEEYKSFTESLEGSFVGVGIVVTEHPSYINIMDIYPESPAARGGLKKGDLIYAVNGQEVAALPYNERIDRLLGPENTAVTLGVLRGTDKISMTLVRTKVQVNPVVSKMLEGDTGYIRIMEFTTHSAEYFESAVAALQKQGMKRLILDLRDNPGGDVESVIRISEHLVPMGTTLITVKYRTGQDSYQSQGVPLGIPLAVLINGNSASGSEMLAGIVKDNKAGTVIGTKSYGKGTAQNIYSIKDGASGGYKMTIAEFFTTSLVKIHQVGILPDIAVTQPAPFAEEKIKNLAVIGDERPVKLGESGLNVMAVEQRLSLMGYTVTTDGIYDQQLAGILKQMDIDVDNNLTQPEARALEKVFLQASQKAEEDLQLKKALEVLKKNN